jgi:LysM repeat protein
MRLRSIVCAGATALVAAVVPADSLRAAPPPFGVVAAAVTLPAMSRRDAQWITHEIVNGESLSEIAARYDVPIASIMRWNKLDPNRPQFWAGEQLKVQTRVPERVRSKLTYIVHPNDTWDGIAQRFGVERDALEKFWNPNEIALQPGHALALWVEASRDVPTVEPVPVVDVPAGAQSFGWPDAGRLEHGVRIPENPALYTVRNPEHAYGSTHAISVLQKSIAAFRARTGFGGQVILWDMSVKRGGHFGPHRSHRTGRDIDIGLPLKAGFEPGTKKPNSVDWEATWHLIHAFIESGEVRYVFLSHAGQATLLHAAKGCGASAEELERVVQYPRTEKVGIVRHAPGHTSHLHVRFTCGEDELGCQEIGERSAAPP